MLGMGLFDFYAAHPEESKVHDQAMRAISAAQVPAIVAAIDLSHTGVLIDVGGGTGELLAGVLAANPSLHGVLFDLPHVVEHALAVFAHNAVADRAKAVGGSFFDSVPAGGDTYLLKTVIHDWDDARAVKILASCRKVMPSDGKLMIIERELPEVGQAGASAEPFLLDLEMLVMTPGGRERTREEFAKLLSDAQFRLTRIVPTASPVSIFEAVPV
jgi:hypothetical protein